jgi:hypothetical protein
MMRPESEWPRKRNFGQTPAEEMWIDMVTVACHTLPHETNVGKEPLRESDGRVRKTKEGKWIRAHSNLQMAGPSRAHTP